MSPTFNQYLLVGSAFLVGSTMLKNHGSTHGSSWVETPWKPGHSPVAEQGLASEAQNVRGGARDLSAAGGRRIFAGSVYWLDVVDPEDLDDLDVSSG